jgi:AraC family transcriptional regulator of adaptative response/methylated-DNA-[protein]-cysteine methyltransferase
LRAGVPVTGAIYGAGFGSASRVYERVATRLGMTPRQYRGGGKGVAISYAVARTPLGLTMMAATDRGLCAVLFGETERALLAELQREYPGATITPMDAGARAPFAQWMAALAAHLEGTRPRLDLPLDVRGTAFQMKVWSFLERIPYGEVRSYAEVAEGIGAPKAVRAVASACAANRLAVAIPCHRVIRGDGGLGGYRWGLARKRALIDAERAGKVGSR